MGTSLAMTVIYGWLIPNAETIKKYINTLSQFIKFHSSDQEEFTKLVTNGEYYDAAEWLSAEIDGLTVKLVKTGNEREDNALLIGIDPKDQLNEGDGWWYRTSAYDLSEISFNFENNDIRKILPKTEPKLIVSSYIK